MVEPITGGRCRIATLTMPEASPLRGLLQPLLQTQTLIELPQQRIMTPQPASMDGTCVTNRALGRANGGIAVARNLLHNRQGRPGHRGNRGPSRDRAGARPRHRRFSSDGQEQRQTNQHHHLTSDEQQLH